MAEILLGLGGNLGDPKDAIESALQHLARAGIRILRRSSFYRTAPWGGVPQPDYINLCASGSTELSPAELLEATQRVEQIVGRQPGVRWGPRIVDVDILTYDDRRIASERLTIPHPRILERAFVLVPLAEIAPDRVIAGRSIASWAADIGPDGVERLTSSA